MGEQVAAGSNTKVYVAEGIVRYMVNIKIRARLKERGRKRNGMRKGTQDDDDMEWQSDVDLQEQKEKPSSTKTNAVELCTIVGWVNVCMREDHGPTDSLGSARRCSLWRI